MCGKNFRDLGQLMRVSKNYRNRRGETEHLIMKAAEKGELVTPSALFLVTHQKKKGGISCVRKLKGFMIDLQSFGHLHRKRVKDQSLSLLRRRSCDGRLQTSRGRGDTTGLDWRIRRKSSESTLRLLSDLGPDRIALPNSSNATPVSHPPPLCHGSRSISW